MHVHVATVCQGQGIWQWLEINPHRQINPVLPRMTHLKAYKHTHTQIYSLHTHSLPTDVAFAVSDLHKLHMKDVRLIFINTLLILLHYLRHFLFVIKDYVLEQLNLILLTNSIIFSSNFVTQGIVWHYSTGLLFNTKCVYGTIVLITNCWSHDTWKHICCHCIDSATMLLWFIEWVDGDLQQTQNAVKMQCATESDWSHRSQNDTDSSVTFFRHHV